VETRQRPGFPFRRSSKSTVWDFRRSGGGLCNILDRVTPTQSTIRDNTAAFEGGGINNNAGAATLDHSTVTDATALLGEGSSSGGGILDFSATGCSTTAP
jgi:hypothetical protein